MVFCRRDFFCWDMEMNICLEYGKYRLCFWGTIAVFSGCLIFQEQSFVRAKMFIYALTRNCAV